MHHVAALANGDEPLFREPADRQRLLDQLGEVVADTSGAAARTA
jgi:hypothetical protein